MRSRDPDSTVSPGLLPAGLRFGVLVTAETRSAEPGGAGRAAVRAAATERVRIVAGPSPERSGRSALCAAGLVPPRVFFFLQDGGIFESGLGDQPQSLPSRFPSFVDYP